jgi:lysophospholipase L1-like esterase
MRPGDISDSLPTPSASAVHLADVERPNNVAIVCLGDSLTGYNNFSAWAVAVYPDFLQSLLIEAGRSEIVANGGQAGEFSDAADSLGAQYLELFPQSTHFVIGFGTNDVRRAGQTHAADVSAAIIRNLDSVIGRLQNADKLVVAFNVPHLNANRFGRRTMAAARPLREYHNDKLAAFCQAKGVPLADICSKLTDDLFDDALHPNAAGALVIAQAVFDLLLPTL